MQKNAQTGALYNTATYLTGPRGPECRRDDTQTELDSQGRTVSKTRWYVYDGLGSVVGEVDPNGSLTSSPKYDVYGLVRSNSGTASSKMGFVGGLGHLSEANTGLIYMKARYYDPQQGRFASQDPDSHGNNWFAYCSNNPVNMVDADGRIEVSPEQERGLIKNLILMAVAWMFCPAFRCLGYGMLYGIMFASMAWFTPAGESCLGKQIFDDTVKEINKALKAPEEGSAGGPIPQYAIFIIGYEQSLEFIMTVMDIEQENDVNILPF